MDQCAPVTPPGLDALVDRLVPFCESLRADGFGLEPAQLIAVHGLILDMAEHGQLPDDLSGFKTLIGPILCSSKREHDEFNRRFDFWVKELKTTGAPVDPQQLLTEPDLGLKLQAAAKQGHRAWLRALPWFVLGGVAAGAAASYALMRWIGLRARPSPLAENTANAPKMFDLFAFLSSTFPVMAGVGFVVIAVLWLLRRWSRRWWDRQAEMVLQRRAAKGSPRTTILRIRPPDPWPIWERQRISRAAVELLRRRPVEAGREVIDVPATVARSVRNLGPTEPVPARRLVTPEYLVLVDRVSLRDHQADWADALVDRLVAQELEMVRYEFAGDPRVCYPRRDAGPAWTLRDLAERYPHHRVLIFSDAEGMIDPRTGRPAAWVEVFTVWQVRAVLTPLPQASWTALEDDLSALGFFVEPATPAGLASLACRITAIEWQSLSSSEAFDGESQPVPPMPAPLRAEPGAGWIRPRPRSMKSKGWSVTSAGTSRIITTGWPRVRFTRNFIGT